MKNPGVAAVLSFIFNGLGQLYNGEIKKGLVLIFVSSIFIILTIVGAVIVGVWLFHLQQKALLVWGCSMFCIGIAGACVVGIYSIVDAYKKAQR